MREGLYDIERRRGFIVYSQHCWHYNLDLSAQPSPGRRTRGVDNMSGYYSTSDESGNSVAGSAAAAAAAAAANGTGGAGSAADLSCNGVSDRGPGGSSGLSLSAHCNNTSRTPVHMMATRVADNCEAPVPGGCRPTNTPYPTSNAFPDYQNSLPGLYGSRAAAPDFPNHPVTMPNHNANYLGYGAQQSTGTPGGQGGGAGSPGVGTPGGHATDGSQYVMELSATLTCCPPNSSTGMHCVRAPQVAPMYPWMSIVGTYQKL